MRILFITSYLPSLIRVRPYNFLKSLAKRGHEITLLSLVQDKGEIRDHGHLSPYCKRVEPTYLSELRSVCNCLRYLFTPVSLQAAYCFSNEMSAKVRKLLSEESFDVVHVEHIRGAHFLPTDTAVPAVFDSVDCISSLYKQFALDKPSVRQRWSSNLEHRKLCRYESSQAARFERIVVTSQKDKEELKKLCSTLRIDVVSNGVDLSYFSPANDLGEKNHILLSGKMSYYANEAAASFFCEKVLPLVTAREPRVRLSIVGSSPSRCIRRYGLSDNVTVTGYVPDMRPFFQTARLAVCPVTVGAGVQNKVLEAMAMGRPVVATSKACQALSAVHGEHLLIADTPEESAESVLRVLHDDELALALGRNGRRYVERHHNWDEKARQLEQTYLKAIASKSLETR